MLGKTQKKGDAFKKLFWIVWYFSLLLLRPHIAYVALVKRQNIIILLILKVIAMIILHGLYGLAMLGEEVK